MQETTSREKVLKKIRNALISKKENPFSSLDFESSVYQSFSDSLDVTFALEFTKVAGKFIYCENQAELTENLGSLIKENEWENVFCLDADLKKILYDTGITFSSEDSEFLQTKVGITKCEYLIARLGSVLISSKQTSGRRLNVFPEIHIVVAYTDQIVSDIKDALNSLKEKYNNDLPSLVSVITGPSRTADIEKTLVMGAHGPKDLYVFLVDKE